MLGPCGGADDVEVEIQTKDLAYLGSCRNPALVKGRDTSCYLGKIFCKRLGASTLKVVSATDLDPTM